MLISTAYIRISTKTETSMLRNRVHSFLFIRGLSCTCSVQTSLTQNCFKLTKPGFPYTLPPVSCGDIGFKKKILCLVMALKSGLKVPLLPSGPSCSLQTIIWSYLVRCDSPLHSNNCLVHFLCLICAKQTLFSCNVLSHPTQEVQI